MPKKLLSIPTLSKCVEPPLPHSEVRAYIRSDQIEGYVTDMGQHAGGQRSRRQLQRLVCKGGKRRPAPTGPR